MTPTATGTQRAADPFADAKKHTRSLRALKRVLVRVGRSGTRRDFELVRRLFTEITELRSA
jgi:hypothetical protein